MSWDDFDYTKKKLSFNYSNRNPVERIFNKSLGKVCSYFMPLGVVLFDPINSPKILRDPNFYKFLFDKEQKVGMLAGAIVSDSQFVPMNFDYSHFSFEQAKAGNYVGVDYLRQNEFPKVKNIANKGSFYGFVLDDLEGVSWDAYYPTSEIDFFDDYYFCSLERPSLFKLLNKEYLHENSYSQALKNVGVYDKLADKLEKYDLGKKSVYQVTPKANGLMFLAKDSGSKKKKVEVRERKFGLVPSFGY